MWVIERSYHWYQVSADGLTAHGLGNLGAYSGAGAASLLISGVGAAQAGGYYCALTNSSGQTQSRIATLTVTTADGGTGGATIVTGGVGWTINGQSAASLNVSGIRRQRLSQRADILTFNAPARAVDAPPLFAYDDPVTVAFGGTVFFRGRVTQTPATGTAQAESQSYTISGPWWELMHRTAQQPWHTADGQVPTPPVYPLSTRLILGQRLDGTRQTTGQTIKDLLDYAIACGTSLAIGQIDPDIYAPLDEMKDVTVTDCGRMYSHSSRISKRC